MVWRLAMSSGNMKGCSKALATYLALPCWKSLIEESIGREIFSTPKWGFKPEHWCDDRAPSPQRILYLRTSFEQSWPLWPLSVARLLWQEDPFLPLQPSCPFGLAFSSCQQGQAEKLGKVEGWGVWLRWPPQAHCPLHGTPRDPEGLF